MKCLLEDGAIGSIVCMYMVFHFASGSQVGRGVVLVPL
jgi:hypothetical protein